MQFSRALFFFLTVVRDFFLEGNKLCNNSF